MAQISFGKLLPNLKITLGNDERESVHSEDGEINESSENEASNTNDIRKVHENDASNSNDAPKVQIVRSWMESLQNPKVYKSKSGGFTTGLDLMSEQTAEKLDKRAERFGLEKDECSYAPNIKLLYESMGVPIENTNSAKMKNFRLDALHMRGINELNTNEIFHYFRDYGPSSVEWINDFSCNVVWLDEESCARALLGVSKPLERSKTISAEKTGDEVESDSVEQSKETTDVEPSITEADNKGDTAMDIDDDSPVKKPDASENSLSLDIPVPPGHWRLGVPHPKAKAILLRFATKDDKKLPGAEKRSDYYKKYGNPNYGGLKGLISSSRKRRMQAAVNKRAVENTSSKNETKSDSSDGSDSDVSVPKVSNPKPPPRMRMYADDEELKIRKKRPNDTEKPRKSVHSRLGSKYTQDDLCHLGSSNRDFKRDYSTKADDDDDYGDDLSDYRSSRSRSTRTLSKRNWPSDNQTDLRSKIKRLRNDNVNKHRSPLCIDDENRSED